MRPGILRTASLTAALLTLCWVETSHAQIDAVEVGFQGLSGRQTAFPLDEVQIYVVELQHIFGNLITSDLGEVGGNEGIQLIVDDLSATTGFVASDIFELRL